MQPRLPDGFRAGHWTHPRGHTGCTVVLAPDGATAGVEVRGGGPGTRETDVLSPASAARHVHGLLLTGGSAFGLAAADGVVGWLAEHDQGHLTRSGIRVPLVPAAVVFDGGALDPDGRPDAAAGRAACEAASTEVPARGRAGAGAGVAAGKLLGPEGWTYTGFGAASDTTAGALVTALAVVNPVGEVVDADGTILAGARGPDGTMHRTADLIRDGHGFADPPSGREATVLVTLLTDAILDRTGAWLLARAATAGVARAVDPVATPYDGDVTFALASGRVEADAFALQVSAAEATAAAIRDAARPH
ncbi:P1 family peptidase [Paraconexibacter antarcticus]|uniref:P1 family peptidase n=1 Tax=Paraconexibacter antarcticus TaxID=2949664 RepID=A0ABY5DY03_9ACTN|nr:P1 family peptidase [Paraconexibacter antarcticus]UTI65439.1 P1 family peptidase [Paraconexibacter antarcticus]